MYFLETLRNIFNKVTRAELILDLGFSFLVLDLFVLFAAKIP